MATRKRKKAAAAPKKKTGSRRKKPTTVEEEPPDDLFEDAPEEDKEFPTHEPSAETVRRTRFVEASKPPKGWGKAADVFDEIDAVSTVFPDFNRASRVGGLAVRRIITVHGPTHGGKTAFVLGLVKSFVDAGFIAGYVDAEYTLGRKFADELVRELENAPNFLAKRPESYEETIEAVDTFLKYTAGLRKQHPDLKSILVVDTINKLVPKRELSKMTGTSKGAEEVSKGHHGRYRASINQAWLDKLTPMIARAECSLVLIAQEREKQSDNPYDDVQVKGGAGIAYDSSMMIRVQKAKPVFRPGVENPKNDDIIGNMHRVKIWKSKVAYMDGRFTLATFHISNGKITPPGLDLARDAFEIGVRVGAVKQNGSWFSYERRKFQGSVKFVKHLSDNPERLHKLLADVQARIEKDPSL